MLEPLKVSLLLAVANQTHFLNALLLSASEASKEILAADERQRPEYIGTTQGGDISGFALIVANGLGYNRLVPRPNNFTQ